MRKLLNEHLDKIEKQTDAVSRTNLTRSIKESNEVPSMALRSLSICAMAVDVTS
jgi:hypothetical protein